MKLSIVKIFLFLNPNRYVLVFLMGFFLSISILFKFNSDYNDSLFNGIGNYIKEESKKNNESREREIIRALNVVYNELSNNSIIFLKNKITGFKATHMRSTELELLDVSGGCGSFSLVLGRVFIAMNYPIRFVQMKVDGKFGGHILLEIWTNNNWIVLDPAFNQYFLKSDSTLASFDDVKNNFNYYKNQLANNYPPSYRYEDARYTNWEKLPIIGPTFKKVLGFIYGEEKTNKLSVRKYFIRFYGFWGKVFTVLFLIPLIVILYTQTVKIKFRND